MKTAEYHAKNEDFDANSAMRGRRSFIPKPASVVEVFVELKINKSLFENVKDFFVCVCVKRTRI